MSRRVVQTRGGCWPQLSAPTTKADCEGAWKMAKKKDPGPSVKDPGLYEALRDDGASKEKAAKISNAAAARGRKSVARKGGETTSYEAWTVPELRRRAAELGITGRSTMRKDQLVKALREG